MTLHLEQRKYTDSISANVIGVAITAREASTPSTPSTPKVQEKCPSNFACPDNDGCTYTDGSRTLELTCGVDFYGGDLDNQWSETLQDCAGACAANEQCVAASFVGGRGSGRCYLKGTNNGANINDNVDGMLHPRYRSSYFERAFADAHQLSTSSLLPPRLNLNPRLPRFR
jgi:hypothetical protein